MWKLYLATVLATLCAAGMHFGFEVDGMCAYNICNALISILLP